MTPAMKVAEEALERMARFLKDWDNAGNHDGSDWFYHEFKAEYEAAVLALALIRAEAEAVPTGKKL